MDCIEHPFSDSIGLNNSTSVLLDACFLLAMVDNTDNRFVKCNGLMKTLIEKDVKKYVTAVVSAEVLNILMVKMFKNDIMASIDNLQAMNAPGAIKHLRTYFSKEEKKKFLNKGKAAERVGYKRAFFKIYKSFDRNLLNVYIQTAIDIQKHMETEFKLKYISINKNLYELSRNAMIKNNLLINDASHFVVSDEKKLGYIVTLDGDFERIQSNNIKVLTV